MEFADVEFLVVARSNDGDAFAFGHGWLEHFHCCFVTSKFSEVWLFLMESHVDDGVLVCIDSKNALTLEYGHKPARLLRSYERSNRVCDKVEHGFVQSGEDAQPEYRTHDVIRAAEIVCDAVFDVLIGGLPHQISAKEQASPNALRVQLTGQCIAAEGCVLAYTDGKAEPARLRIRRALR